MDMVLLVSGARVAGRAAVGIGRADLEDVLIDVIAMHVMQMAIVEIVGVTAVCDSPVTTGWTMLVGVILMLRTRAHGDLRI
jgi:hypothetical protein